MALIKAQGVYANAIKASFPNQLFFSKIAGVVQENADLKGAGAGDTITFTNFDLAPATLQSLNRGDEITVNEIGQSQFNVKIAQLAHGKRFYDVDEKYTVSGGSLASEVVSQISGAFAHGLDDLSVAALVNNSVKKDLAEGEFTVNKILDEATAKFGESTFDGNIAAMVIHPSKFAELRQDPNFEPVSSYANPVVGAAQGATYGANEVGRLYGVIPVVILNKVPLNAGATKRQNILVPKASVLSVIGKDLNLEIERQAKTKSTNYYADIFVGIAGIKEGIVFEA